MEKPRAGALGDVAYFLLCIQPMGHALQRCAQPSSYQPYAPDDPRPPSSLPVPLQPPLTNPATLTGRDHAWRTRSIWFISMYETN